MENIQLLLVDRSPMFLAALKNLLESKPNVKAVFTCSSRSGNEVVENARQLEPDIIVMDVDTELPKYEVFEILGNIRQLLPSTKIIVLSYSEKEEDLFLALQVGATGYIAKDAEIEDLVKTIDLVEKGELVMSSSMAKRLLEVFTLLKKLSQDGKFDSNFGLSEREKEVLALISNGYTNREIARSLFITENTVKGHIRHIMEKLHASNRQEAVAISMRKGVFPKLVRVD